MNDIIRIENLYHTYPGAHPVEALRGIDLTIHSGEYVAIVGANGSGKSTLARHLNALLLPARGNVWVDRLNTRDAGTSRRDIRTTVQMVFQHPDSQLVATVVEEDVVFGPENFGVPETELAGRVRDSLEMVGMWTLRARAPYMLSAGQKQRVAIAGALAVNPRVLIFDEATSMLDPAGREAVLEILRQLHARGTTIITITHEMDEAAQAERVIVMNEGRIAMDDAPCRVFAHANELHELELDVPNATALALQLGLPVCLSEEALISALLERGQRVYSPSPIQQKARGDDSDSIIHVDQLSHWYLRGLPLESRALDNVDLNVPRSEATGLIGKTGSGKSTLMQHFNALLRPQAGNVTVGQYDLADPKVDARAVRQMVGLVFQDPEDQLFEHYVGDDVAFAPRQFGLDKSAVRERVRWAMGLVGLGFESFKDRLTSTLSGGERRRAALAGVFAMQPQVLVADEPTAGLDPRMRAEVLDILRRLRDEGTTLVISSHRMEDIAALCSRAAMLDDGHVIAVDSTRNIFSQPERLHSHGLAGPLAARVAHALRSRGWDLPEGILNNAELVAAVGC